ncbi:MAG: cysteine hydrolase family protein [Eubacteriales bacterium]
MNKLLVVVDYQNDFVDGSLGFPKAAELHEKICDKILCYRAQGQPIVFTLDTHEPDYIETQEGRNLPVPHCIRGTAGHNLFGRVNSLSQGCEKFEKGTFGSDLLFTYLQKSIFESIEIVGLVSNICVISNAVLAKTALPEALILVDAACTASFDPLLNEKTLDILEGLQIKVTNR